MLHFILLVGGAAFGQTNWGSVGTVTFALTLHETGPANTIKDDESKVVPTAQGGGANLTNSYTVRTFDRQGNETKKVETEETISKIRVSKYGNAELIAKLVVDGVLPQKGKNAIHCRVVGAARLYDQRRIEVLRPTCGQNHR